MLTVKNKKKENRVKTLEQIIDEKIVKMTEGLADQLSTVLIANLEILNAEFSKTKARVQQLEAKLGAMTNKQAKSKADYDAIVRTHAEQKAKQISNGNSELVKILTDSIIIKMYKTFGWSTARKIGESEYKKGCEFIDSVSIKDLVI